MSKFMRILVCFDLPVQTKTERKTATKFRNFLLKDGYYMIQFSLYGRVCNGYDSVETHHERLLRNLPDNGSIRYLVITEKQYESMEVLVGELKKEEDPITPEQLTLY